MTTLSEMFDSFLVCTDHQFYFDKAIEKGILSPEKDAHNYAGHFMFMHYDMNTDRTYFKDTWSRRYLVCNVDTGEIFTK
jgi:hypothetical protein